MPHDTDLRNLQALLDEPAQRSIAPAVKLAILQGAAAVADGEAEFDSAVRRLDAAIKSYATTQRAIGVLMAQQRCSAAEARTLLHTVSERRRVSIDNVAAGILTGIERRTGSASKRRY